MPRWAADDMAWDSFDKARLDPDLLLLVKAAALTEYNAARYTQYLKNVFEGDQAFADAVDEWQAEEEQHGRVLGRYAELAAPGYAFEGTFARFCQGYVIPVEVERSIRGSRVGELLSRCVVETGTSSFYTALAEAADEPLLKQICKRIAGDEFRHYRMFLAAMRTYQPQERVSLFERIKVAAGRVRESDDDELAFAYHCANEPPELPYDRARCNKAYGARAFRLYRRHHAERAVGMIFKASGLNPQGLLGHWVSRWAYRKMRQRAVALAA